MARESRDWSTVRSREWVRTDESRQEYSTAGGSSSSAASGRGDGRLSGHARGRGARGRGSGATATAGGYAPEVASAPASFRTDGEITSATSSRTTSSRAGEPRQLQAWVPVNSAKEDSQLFGTLEELNREAPRHNGRGQLKGWDQFEVNARLFGVTSTYKTDLSQYTTPLNPNTLPSQVRARAKQIADEIEHKSGKKGGSAEAMDCGVEEEEDEEDLWSAVPRNANSHGSNGWSNWDGSQENNSRGNAASTSAAASEDGGLGGALLASLRAGAMAGGDGTAKTAGCDYRSRIAPKVQGWWRARILAGATVPAGADGDALVCPFSQRVFGDVSQLVTHWAAALPRDEDKGQSSTTAGVVTEQFRQASKKLRWSEMSSLSGLDNMLSVADPKTGSVWAQVVTKLQGRRSSSEPVENRFVSDFVTEAVQMRCWRRDQKVEHREVLEGIAAGLALHMLSDPGSSGWVPEMHHQAAGAVAGDGRCRGDGNGVGASELAVGVCH